jgi:hypothetical protein
VAASSNAPGNTATSPAKGRGIAAETSSGLDDKLRGAAAGLASTPDAAGRRQVLAVLGQILATGDRNEVSTAIRRFLESKTDAPTGQGFKLGAKGALNEAPTLRTFLLDYLGQMDPAAAAAYARVILSEMGSPDEWAVALRNLAAGDASREGRSLLEQKIGDLLRQEAWQRDASAGFLEAFDVAVFVGGTNLVPTLGNLVRKQDNPAVAHAAYLALDRLVLRDPSELLAALAGDAGLMQGREATRADYFARADVRDSRQRQVLEGYLLDPQRSAAELAHFAGVYPNANFMISPNLLTPSPTLDHATLASRDAAALATVQGWLADPRFTKLRPELEKMKVRLEGFGRQQK